MAYSVLGYRKSCHILLYLLGNVRFGDILQNEDSFHNYLTSSLHLNNSVADAIINSTIHTQAVSTLILLSLYCIFALAWIFATPGTGKNLLLS